MVAAVSVAAAEVVAFVAAGSSEVGVAFVVGGIAAALLFVKLSYRWDDRSPEPNGWYFCSTCQRRTRVSEHTIEAEKQRAI